jgi:hypothetical protein
MKDVRAVKKRGHGLEGSRLVWIVGAGTILLAVATVVFIVLGWSVVTPPNSFGLKRFGGLSFIVASMAFGSTGAVITSRIPRNPIGWIFCLIAILMGLGNLAYQYADYTLYVSPGTLPGGKPPR